MRHATASLLVFVLLLLGGCTHMSPGECKQADWLALGQQDGLAGETLATLDQRRSSCAEAGVAVDAQKYMLGRERGLATYCRPHNGLEIGLQGKTYQGVCAPEQAAPFRRLYDVGRESYLARTGLEEMDRRRVGLEERLRRSTSDDDKRSLRQQLADLDVRLRAARNRVRDAEAAVARVR
jgi:hypothetical protein